jgi:hypothetical protein
MKAYGEWMYTDPHILDLGTNRLLYPGSYGVRHHKVGLRISFMRNCRSDSEGSQPRHYQVLYSYRLQSHDIQLLCPFVLQEVSHFRNDGENEESIFTSILPMKIGLGKES